MDSRRSRSVRRAVVLVNLSSKPTTYPPSFLSFPAFRFYKRTFFLGLISLALSCHIWMEKDGVVPAWQGVFQQGLSGLTQIFATCVFVRLGCLLSFFLFRIWWVDGNDTLVFFLIPILISSPMGTCLDVFGRRTDPSGWRRHLVVYVVGR